MPNKTATCKHCGRNITYEIDKWVDINATGDDAIWSETCDSHDTLTAEHEPAEPTPEITTEDGKTVREGDRVFNYYDGWWGTLGPIDSEGWADVFGDGKRAYLNGSRIATYDPRGTTDPNPNKDD